MQVVYVQMELTQPRKTKLNNYFILNLGYWILA